MLFRIEGRPDRKDWRSPELDLIAEAIMARLGKRQSEFEGLQALALGHVLTSPDLNVADRQVYARAVAEELEQAGSHGLGAVGAKPPTSIIEARAKPVDQVRAMPQLTLARVLTGQPTAAARVSPAAVGHAYRSQGRHRRPGSRAPPAALRPPRPGRRHMTPRLWSARPRPRSGRSDRTGRPRGGCPPDREVEEGRPSDPPSEGFRGLGFPHASHHGPNHGPIPHRRRGRHGVSDPVSGLRGRREASGLGVLHSRRRSVGVPLGHRAVRGRRISPTSRRSSMEVGCPRSRAALSTLIPRVRGEVAHSARRIAGPHLGHLRS